MVIGYCVNEKFAEYLKNIVRILYSPRKIEQQSVSKCYFKYSSKVHFQNTIINAIQNHIF